MYFVGNVEGVNKMGMRETVGSLRAYFILSGLAGMYYAVRFLMNAGIVGMLVELVSIGFGLAFLYVGFALSRLLRSSSSRIIKLLYLSACWSVFVSLSSAGWSVYVSRQNILGGLSVDPLNFPFLALSLLIVWYLLRNVRRLAGEAQPSPTEPPVSAPN
jgi:hypothetical protein